LAVSRLEKIDVTDYCKLAPDDECYYIGEYTSRGGYKASTTNQQILNLKIRPSSPDDRLHWKRQAVAYWIRTLASYISLEKAERNVTFVPAPSSKASGHPDFDDRVHRILLGLKAMRPGLDIREAVVSTGSREAQHENGRLSIEELRLGMRLARHALQTPPKRVVYVVDDVFTTGGTFKAMQELLLDAPGVEVVKGLFLARTIWPPIAAFDLGDFDD
jgi:hypothetical protein